MPDMQTKKGCVILFFSRHRALGGGTVMQPVNRTSAEDCTCGREGSRATWESETSIHQRHLVLTESFERDQEPPSFIGRGCLQISDKPH